MTHRLPKPRAWLAQVALILTGVLIISSCASATAESEFFEDGTATYSIEVTLDTGQIGALASIAGFDLEDQLPFGLEAEQQLNALGYTFETIREDDLIGFRATKEDAEAANVADDLNQMFSVGTQGVTGINPFSGTFTQDGDTYTLDLTVDGDDLSFADLGDSIEIPDFGFGGFGGIDFDDALEITYTAKMPGEIDEDETNGRILSDSRVRWTIPTSGTEQFIAVSSTGSASEFPVLLVAGVSSFCLVAAALLALLVVVLLMRRSPSLAPATATAGPPPAQQAVSTRELTASADTAQLPTMPAADASVNDDEAGETESLPDTGDQDEPDVDPSASARATGEEGASGTPVEDVTDGADDDAEPKTD